MVRKMGSGGRTGRETRKTVSDTRRAREGRAPACTTRRRGDARATSKQCRLGLRELMLGQGAIPSESSQSLQLSGERHLAVSKVISQQAAPLHVYARAMGSVLAAPAGA